MSAVAAVHAAGAMALALLDGLMANTRARACAMTFSTEKSCDRETNVRFIVG